MLLTLINAAFGYGDNLIFQNVNVEINEGEKIGLIGGNGEGKTTLIKTVTGELLLDGGELQKKRSSHIGYLEQNGGYLSGNTVYNEMLSVFSDDISAVKKCEDLSAKLSEISPYTPEYASISTQIENLHKYIQAHDSYNVEVKIKTVLNGMGFLGYYDRIIDTLSGGEKTRLKLSRLLLEEPDLLILDEPTNHLDISSLSWLEEYLLSFKGAVLIVSHDRYFLDKLISKTWEMENKTIQTFSGNYSKYKVLKQERIDFQMKEFERQQEEIAKLQDYVARNIVRATTAKSALSRVKQLEKMEILEKPFLPPKPPKYRFTYGYNSYEEVLQIKNLDLKIDEKTLFESGNLNIKRGEKVAIVGENGTGKTTLLKAIFAGKHENIVLGRQVKLAYYDQEAKNLNEDETVLYELWGRHSGLTQTEVRSLLASGGLFEEDMTKPVKALSGGERAKLALCVLESEQGNTLLLDEPTNHLDLVARESLEKALKEFDGTLIFVSHDRYFLKEIAQKIVEIEENRLKVYDGGYEFYLLEKIRQREILARQANEKLAEQEVKKRTESYRNKKQRADEERKKEQIKRIEADIYAVERKIDELNAELSNPETARDYAKVNSLSAELDEKNKLLETLYIEYEKVL